MASKLVSDINILAIYLVENHPGFPYVQSKVDEIVHNGDLLITFDFAPFRVHWILTKKWGLDDDIASEAVLSLMKLSNLKLVPLDKIDIKRAFELSKFLNHDVYDVVHLVLALKENAKGILTTDRDFKKLAPKLGLSYVNPVPEEILKRFHAYK